MIDAPNSIHYAGVNFIYRHQPKAVTHMINQITLHSLGLTGLRAQAAVRDWLSRQGVHLGRGERKNGSRNRRASVSRRFEKPDYNRRLFTIYKYMCEQLIGGS